MTAVVLGTPIDDVTLDEAVDQISRMVAVGRATGRTHQVATVNVDFVVNAVRRPDVLDVLQRTDLSIPDGMPLVWVAPVLGGSLRERSAGADLLPALALRAAQDRLRLCLYGGRPGVAERAAAVLRERSGSNLDVVALEAPVVGADGSMDPGALEDVEGIGADILAVALGNPKQEMWIERHREALGVPVLIGVGGSLDFLVGETTRAPAWMRRAGLEWLHRAGSEPRRLVGRYATDFAVFGPGVLAQAWRGRRRRRWPPLVDRGDQIDARGRHGLTNAEIVSIVRRRRQSGGAPVLDHVGPDLAAQLERLRVADLVMRGA